MYDLADVVPDTEVEPGTNLLVVGPPMTGKRGLALRILASGSKKGEGAIIVTTKDGAGRMLKEYQSLVDDIETIPLGIVDCVSKQQSFGTLVEDDQIQYTSSPVDMTGIGISLSEFLETFINERELLRNRVLLHSLTTLLMYSNLQTVFRFLHVFTGRIQTADGLGVYTIDGNAHDDQTMNTLKQLFDGILHVEEDGGTRLQMAGFDS